jgi:hypothetical protein
MVKNSKILERFEREIIRKSKSGYGENIKIVNKLLLYAIQMKKFPPKNKFEGLETDIHFAKVINSVR